MKKLIMITAMFMAMNTWSADYPDADYKVCYVQGYTDEIEECASEWVKKGYEPIGDLIVREGRSKWVFFQAFWKQG